MKLTTLLLSLSMTTLLSAEIEHGKHVYAANCAICHTVNGGNLMGPDMNIVSYTRSNKDIADYIKDPYAHYARFGYSANAMPTLPLPDNDIQAVTAYIDSLQPFKKWMKK